jgi:hypothetical protein
MFQPGPGAGIGHCHGIGFDETSSAALVISDTNNFANTLDCIF